MNQSEYKRAVRNYLRDRMQCEWVEAPLVGRQRKPRHVCKRCSRQKPDKQHTFSDSLHTCTKRRKPNRWRLHFRRESYRWGSAAQEQRKLLKRPLDVRLMEELTSLEQEAKHLPQTMAVWAFHPVPRRYRRIMRRLWAMPLSAEALSVSPSKDRLLTARGTVEAYATRDTYLDRMFAKRNRITRVRNNECFSSVETDEQVSAVHEWRETNGFERSAL